MQSWLDIGVIHKNKRGAQGSSFIGVHAGVVWYARHFQSNILSQSFHTTSYPRWCISSLTS